MAISWQLARWWSRASVPVTDGNSISADATVLELQQGEAQALFGFVRRLGLTDAEADEAVQEVLVRLLRTLREGSTIASPRAWAYRAIYRLAMDEHRLRRRIIGLVGRLREREQIPHHADLVVRIVVWGEVDRLPERQRQVLYLRYRSDLAFEEIGHVLGISASAARSHATQAMKTLRGRLTAEIEDL